MIINMLNILVMEASMKKQCESDLSQLPDRAQNRFLPIVLRVTSLVQHSIHFLVWIQKGKHRELFMRSRRSKGAEHQLVS